MMGQGFVARWACVAVGLASVLGVAGRAPADGLEFAGLTFVNTSGFDRATALNTSGLSQVIGDATVDSGPEMIFGPVTFPVVDPVAFGFDGTGCLGSLADLTSNAFHAVVLGDETGTARHGLRLLFSSNGVLDARSGADLVLYEVGTADAPAAFMLRVRDAATNGWSGWFYRSAVGFDVFPNESELGAFAHVYDLADLGVTAGSAIDALEVVNLVPSDRLSASGLSMVGGVVLPEDGGATSAVTPDLGALTGFRPADIDAWSAELLFAGVLDCATTPGGADDCNGDGVVDLCQFLPLDCDSDGLLDACEVDCDSTGLPDDCELFDDCNSTGVPDACELAGNDCNVNGVPDECDADCDFSGTPDDCEALADCDDSGVADACEILAGTADDCNANGVPDECEIVVSTELLATDFESGFPNGWTATGLWHATTACAGPNACDPVQWAYFGNDATCDFELFARVQGELTATTVAIPADALAARLTYCSRYDGERGSAAFPPFGFDRAWVSVNGVLVDDVGVSSLLDRWTDREVDLSGFAGQAVTLRWHFDSVDPNNNATLGWQIDRVALTVDQINDCNTNGIPDDCDEDCDNTGLPDDCEVFADCNASGVPDACELIDNDCNVNGVPDECDVDCDINGLVDVCEPGFVDCNTNGLYDVCELIGNDCDSNGVPDECDVDCNANGTPDACEDFADCNSNAIPDECELSGNDCDANGIPDECDPDCNANGTADACELDGNDCNTNGLPDDCDVDCNQNGTPDDCEVFADCNTSGVPDECELFGNDCDSNGVPDECDTDCNTNGTPDACEVFSRLQQRTRFPTNAN
jgi:hypothetical protein